MVYAARTYEGALLEQLVHAGIGRLPRNRVGCRILLPEDAVVSELDPAQHPEWRREPASRAMGEAWARSGEALALVVPSFVAPPWGRNVLINPAHPAFGRVEVPEMVDVVWDPRLT